MITSMLLGALVVCALVQPCAPRLFSCIVFAGVTWAHELFLSHLTGLPYYGSAALFDLAIIVLTSGVRPVPAVVIRLQEICLVSIVANLMGYLLWASFLPPVAYDVCFTLIYLWAVISMLKKDAADDVGGFTEDSWGSCIRFGGYARDSGLRKDEGTA